jgi:hypothetical protein
MYARLLQFFYYVHMKACGEFRVGSVIEGVRYHIAGLQYLGCACAPSNGFVQV